MYIITGIVIGLSLMYSSISYQTSGLESIARETSIHYYAVHTQQPQYNLTKSCHHSTIPVSSLFLSYASEKSYHTTVKPSILYELFKTNQEYHFTPETFLNPDKDLLFVGKADQVQEFVEEAFMLVCQEPLPKNIKISILDETEFRILAPNPGVLGLSINRSQWGLMSEIFVLNSTLGRVMLTLGHELGHVLSATLASPQDEEAKAYAFSMLWMKMIKEHNVGNLQDVIVLENPAHNGLHNVGFSLVQCLLDLGTKEKEIYFGILKGIFSTQHRVLA